MLFKIGLRKITLLSAVHFILLPTIVTVAADEVSVGRIINISCPENDSDCLLSDEDRYVKVYSSKNPDGLQITGGCDLFHGDRVVTLGLEITYNVCTLAGRTISPGQVESEFTVRGTCSDNGISTKGATGYTEASLDFQADYPPSANPGECFARVLIPETTAVVTEQVVDRPESAEVTVIPAVYGTETRQVLLKAESFKYTVIPAVYETVTEQVIVEPESTKTVVIPATFESYTEQVLVRDAYSTWKPGAGLYGRGGAASTNAGANNGGVATGELLCRIEIPAQYDTVTRTRLVTPETNDTIVIPAKYGTVIRQVFAKPPQVVEEVIPAVYDTITTRVELTPAATETTVIPATYRTIDKRVVTSSGGLEWREVLCDTNASSAKISQIQAALTAAGYSAPSDGAFGPATLSAMESFQRANGLPVGYLTMSTVDALGVAH